MGMALNFSLLQNRRLMTKLVVVVVMMFGFGYALVPLYLAICQVLGINVLALSDQRIASGSWSGRTSPPNTQVDTTRTITVEFDANARGPWDFKPAMNSIQVHPGQIATVMYEFRNKQSRTMAAQAIPSYAPMHAGAHFTKLECFCFAEHRLAPGESKQWPVVFVVDAKLPKDVNTVTLSYTFFEVGGKVPSAPLASAADRAPPLAAGKGGA